MDNGIIFRYMLHDAWGKPIYLLSISDKDNSILYGKPEIDYEYTKQTGQLKFNGMHLKYLMDGTISKIKDILSDERIYNIDKIENSKIIMDGYDQTFEFHYNDEVKTLKSDNIDFYIKDDKEKYPNAHIINEVIEKIAEALEIEGISKEYLSFTAE